MAVLACPTADLVALRLSRGIKHSLSSCHQLEAHVHKALVEGSAPYMVFAPMIQITLLRFTFLRFYAYAFTSSSEMVFTLLRSMFLGGYSMREVHPWIRPLHGNIFCEAANSEMPL